MTVRGCSFSTLSFSTPSKSVPPAMTTVSPGALSCRAAAQLSNESAFAYLNGCMAHPSSCLAQGLEHHGRRGRVLLHVDPDRVRDRHQCRACQRRSGDLADAERLEH